MTKPLNIYKPADVVIVPFPFTDSAESKRRPALVLSSAAFNKHGHTICAMITSAMHSPWPADFKIKDLDSAGLSVPCVVRLKVFTIDNRLILSKIGALTADEFKKHTAELRKVLT